MAFLLDTNVISETVKPEPNPRVLHWLSEQNPAELFLTAQTIGELVRGAKKFYQGKRRSQYLEWIRQDLPLQFEGRILPFSTPAAITWGDLMGGGDRSGRTPAALDAQIASIAICHDLVLVTRNEKDFKYFDVSVVNPWRSH